jgi:hypothetical protein
MAESQRRRRATANKRPHASVVFSQSARQAGRDEYEREAEAKALAWCRKEWGSLGGPFDPTFDVMLAKGGPIARLMRADLSSQKGADHYFCDLHTADGSRPTLEQLRKAQAIGRALDVAIMSGSNPENWELVGRAHNELRATLARRSAAVAVLAELRAYRERDDQFRQRRAERGLAPHVDGPGEGLSFRATKAREDLVRLDQRFASVTPAALAALACEPKLGARGMAVRLSLSTGAFDDGKRENEADAAAIKRVKKNYEKGSREVPTR